MAPGRRGRMLAGAPMPHALLEQCVEPGASGPRHGATRPVQPARARSNILGDHVLQAPAAAAASGKRDSLPEAEEEYPDRPTAATDRGQVEQAGCLARRASCTAQSGSTLGTGWTKACAIAASVALLPFCLDGPPITLFLNSQRLAVRR